MIEELMTMSGKLGDGSFTCMDLVRCMFNLNDTELRILRTLEEGVGETAAEVASGVGRDRSTTYRGLEKLVAAGLVYKERRGGKTRGYSNVYRRMPKRELEQKAESTLDDCYKKLKKAIKDGA